MAPNEDNPEERNKQKKYLWFGYGSYSGAGESGSFNPGNIRADPSIFDQLLELFGIKDKPEKESKDDRK